MKKVLILSKSCIHCKKLLDIHLLKLVSSDIKMLFVEDREREEVVNKYMSLAKAKLSETNPEVENYAYIAPVLLLFSEDDSYEVLAGFTLIDNYLSENL